MGNSERLRQEKAILEQIRTSLSLAGAFLDLNTQRYLENPLHQVVYTSSPTTTGLRFYEALKNNPDKPLSEIKRDVMRENIESGMKLGEELSQAGFAHVIVPGKFFAEGWTQEHYMSLWEQVINRFATIICFNDGWQYSTGCVEEFLIGLQKEKDMTDRTLSALDPRLELQKIGQAIEHIDEMGLEPSKLYDVYRRAVLYVESLPAIVIQNPSGYRDLVS